MALALDVALAFALGKKIGEVNSQVTLQGQNKLKSVVWPFWAIFRGKSEISGVPNFGQKRQKTCFFSN